ncbi:MAG: inositol monophosphatase family protein [Opitutales bacterium]
MDSETLHAFINELIDISIEVIMPYWASDDLAVDRKKDNTVVTEADRGAEAAMRKRISERFPDHGVIGEEYGTDRADAEYVWVLDPIDGTISFTHRIPLFGTLIALKHQGQPILGAISQPVLGERLVGDGSTTTLNGKPVRVTETGDLANATVLTTDTRRAARLQPDTHWDRIAEASQVYRTWGDAYGYLMVGTGRADAMVDPIANEWDFIGHIPIIRGAGGIITDWAGNAPVDADGKVAESVVAANAALHPRIMQMLHG